MHLFVSISAFQKIDSEKPTKLTIDCRSITKKVESALGINDWENPRQYSDSFMIEYLNTNLQVQHFFTESFRSILLFIHDAKLLAEFCFIYDERPLIATYFAERALDLLKSQKRKVYWLQNETA